MNPTDPPASEAPGADATADAAPPPVAAPRVDAAPDAPDVADVSAEAAAADGPPAVGAPAEADAPASPTPAATAATPEKSAADLSPAACAARLGELFPALFGPEGPPKPIKLRIQVDIQQRAPGVFSKRVLSLFLSRHTTSTAYIKALLLAPHRFDLDGQPAGEISELHKAAATEELARRRQVVDARRAAERDARRGAERQARDAQRAEYQARRNAQAQAQAHHAQAQAQIQVQTEAQAQADEQARQETEAEGAARRDRFALLRAFEGSTLTKANFCALKGLTQADLDAVLAQARQERDRRPPAAAPGPQPRSPQPSGPHRPRA